MSLLFSPCAGLLFYLVLFDIYELCQGAYGIRLQGIIWNGGSYRQEPF